MKPRLPPPGDPMPRRPEKLPGESGEAYGCSVLMEGAVWYSVVLGGRSGRSAAGFLIGGPVPCLGVFPPIAAAGNSAATMQNRQHPKSTTTTAMSPSSPREFECALPCRPALAPAPGQFPNVNAPTQRSQGSVSFHNLDFFPCGPGGGSQKRGEDRHAACWLPGGAIGPQWQDRRACAVPGCI